MVSLFGESSVAKRADGSAFGAFRVPPHLALVIATDGKLSPAGRSTRDEMFDEIERMAANHYKAA